MPTAAPWLAHYDPGVPATLEPYSNRTLIEYLADAARDRPQAPALLFKGATLSYSALDRLSDACAAAFAALGVSRGDRVGLLLPNCPQFFIAEFGAWKLGAIVAPLNPIYTEHEIEAAVTDSGVTTMVTLSRFYQRVKNIQHATGVRRVISTNIKEFFPPLLRVLFTLFRETRDGDRIRLRPGDHDFAHLLLVNRARKPAVPVPTTKDPAVLLMSGGTTGNPKGVLGSHGAYAIAGMQIKAWHASTLHGTGDVTFLPLPLFHVYGNVGVQALTFMIGAAIAIVPNPRDLPDLLATIKRVKPTFFAGVPTLYVAMLNHPLVKQGKIDFSSIRICFSGASALLADTKTRFESLTGARIVEGYSLTEAMMAACVNPVKGPHCSVAGAPEAWWDQSACLGVPPPAFSTGGIGAGCQASHAPRAIAASAITIKSPCGDAPEVDVNSQIPTPTSAPASARIAMAMNTWSSRPSRLHFGCRYSITAPLASAPRLRLASAMNMPPRTHSIVTAARPRADQNTMMNKIIVAAARYRRCGSRHSRPFPFPALTEVPPMGTS